MSLTSTINRRDFLKVTSAGGAGLVIGFYLPSVSAAEIRPGEAAETFAPNAWLSIEKSGSVTITIAKSEMGQGVRTSLAMLVAEELEADWSKVRIRQATADPDKYGSQWTGGSRSVRNSADMLRKAGAAAREMLIAAAAAKWSVDKVTCYAEQNTVFHNHSGRKLSYGELTDLASVMPVPDSPTLKDRKNFHIVGKPTPRLDTRDKTNGTAIFGIDIKVPDMLYAAIARPSVFGAKLVRFNAAMAKNMNGVKQVVQIDDSVAVIATSTWMAFQGRDALSITWDEGRYANQTSEAIWRIFEEKSKLDGNVERKEGDANAAYGAAARQIEAIYRTPFVAHATMEPMNCTAFVKGDRCEIWAPSQTPQKAQSEAASVLGIPVGNVKLNVTLLGGGFGRRLESDYVVEAVKVARAIQEPVKVTWTREDDMRHDFYRPSTYNMLKGGLDNQGNPVAWMHRIIGPSAKGLVVGGSTPQYAIPNVLIDSHIEETGVPIGAWRSVGYSQNCFVIESFIDELAHAAKKDPFDFRRALLAKSSVLKGVLELAAAKAEWGKPLPAGTGRGIACVEGFGSAVAQVAEVSVSGAGELKVSRVVCAIDCGPIVNPDTIEAQMESSIVYGLSASIKSEITIEKGGVKESNFDEYDVLRMNEMPKVEVHIVPESESLGGVGEPAVPPIAPAVANAIFAATGQRIRRLPITLKP